MNVSRSSPRLRRIRCAIRMTVLAQAALLATGASALEIDSGNEDLSIRFDNTFKASTMYRLKNADPALVDATRQVPTGAPAPAPASFAFPQALNFNAGDDNFRNKGFASKRIDLLSEFDIVYRKTFGARVSAAGWYDRAYRGQTDATDLGNGQSPYNEFPESTRKLAGRKAEVLDAFVFGGVELGEGRKLTARLGRHALQYGETLFFGDNGIARAQGPVDVMKLQSSPNAQFKEIIRPVPQLSTQLQLSQDVTLGGYYQFRWEADRMAPAGSYFNTSNNIWGSTLPEIFGTFVLPAGSDKKPPNSGQFGAQLKWRLDEADLGFYAARYHDKSGVFYSHVPTDWYYVFPEAITTVGASVTRTVGGTNFSVEASVRNNMPLVNENIGYGFFPGQPEPKYARGRTAHVNVSWLATLGPNLLARESTFIGELAFNSVLKYDDPDHQIDPLRTRNASALQVIFSPTYRQALAGLDLSVPLGLRYALEGRSSITGQGWGPRGTGAATLGVEGNYLGVWQFTMNYTRYIGKATPFVDYTPLLTGGTPNYKLGNDLADRDNISVSLRRTF